MPNVRRVGTLVWKESLQIIRDPSSIFIAFVLPLVLLLLFGYGVTLDLKDIYFGVALEDGGAEARALASAFEGAPNFSVVEDIDRAPLMRGVALGELKGVVVIPHGFSASLLRRSPADPPRIQLITDGVFPNTAALIRNYAMMLASDWFAEISGRSMPVRIESRVWYNADIDSSCFIIPALIVVIMTLTGTMLTALVVAREWERGTMEALLSSPVIRLELMLGKLIPYYLLSIMSTYFCVIISTLCFGIPFRGSALALLAVGTVFMLGALSLGLIISNVTKNQYAASIGSLMLSFLPAVMLSGGIFELSSMPRFQQIVGAVLPGKYLASCLLTLFLAGDVPEVLVPNLLALAVIGTLGLAANYLLTATRIE